MFFSRWLQLPLYLGLIVAQAVYVVHFCIERLHLVEVAFGHRVNLTGHPDEPEWRSHVNASVLKVTLAMALVGISSIHLLKTFIGVNFVTDRVVIAHGPSTFFPAVGDGFGLHRPAAGSAGTVALSGLGAASEQPEDRLKTGGG